MTPAVKDYRQVCPVNLTELLSTVEQFVYLDKSLSEIHVLVVNYEHIAGYEVENSTSAERWRRQLIAGQMKIERLVTSILVRGQKTTALTRSFRCDHRPDNKVPR